MLEDLNNLLIVSMMLLAWSHFSYMIRSSFMICSDHVIGERMRNFLRVTPTFWSVSRDTRRSHRNFRATTKTTPAKPVLDAPYEERHYRSCRNSPIFNLSVGNTCHVFTFLRIPISKEFLLEFPIYLFANTSVRKLFGFRSIMGIPGQAVVRTYSQRPNQVRSTGTEVSQSFLYYRVFSPWKQPFWRPVYKSLG